MGELRDFSGDDVDAAVWWVVDAFSPFADRDWDVPAGGVEWTCWETFEHVADDLMSYAAQLSARRPPADRDLHFDWAPRRPGGPYNIVSADRAGGVRGLLEVLESCGGLLSSVVRTVGAGVRAHHTFGVAGREGFAAMGVVEVLVHSFDVAQGLGVAWEPPGELVSRVVGRLFPNASGTEVADLLWATGRGEFAGRERLAKWRWVNH